MIADPERLGELDPLILDRRRPGSERRIIAKKSFAYSLSLEPYFAQLLTGGGGWLEMSANPLPLQVV
ncbi:hypothetical protein ACQPYK_26420 [Streptosporangium sp. CA-135522]|uniref:hypothetical protein n=1 Tax=Streptosporangium sp. CA-135522 TaxID=3240072 RepID=UPI003D91BF75